MTIERDLDMFTEHDEAFYWAERLPMEINKPSSQCIKQVKALVELIEHYIKECRNIREFYYSVYF